MRSEAAQHSTPFVGHSLRGQEPYIRAPADPTGAIRAAPILAARLAESLTLKALRDNCSVRCPGVAEEEPVHKGGFSENFGLSFLSSAFSSQGAPCTSRPLQRQAPRPAAAPLAWGGGGWHKASVLGCLPLAAPIGLSPLLILREGGGRAKLPTILGQMPVVANTSQSQCACPSTRKEQMIATSHP